MKEAVDSFPKLTGVGTVGRDELRVVELFGGKDCVVVGVGSCVEG